MRDLKVDPAKGQIQRSSPCPVRIDAGQPSVSCGSAGGFGSDAMAMASEMGENSLSVQPFSRRLFR